MWSVELLKLMRALKNPAEVAVILSKIITHSLSSAMGNELGDGQQW